MSQRDPDWAPPSRFDDFAVVAPLGRGGMGCVYLGRDLALDRPVALKFIRSETPDETERKRFEVEARAIARLVHPNVVQVYRFGEVEGRPYIAYEFVSGRAVCDLEAPLPWTYALKIAVGLAQGLAAVHRAGLVHRDVKSANLVLSDDGVVKLLDFGLARGSSARLVQSAFQHDAEPLSAGVSRDGSVTGTPAYMAPELWAGAQASPRSDVFAAGLVLYDLLAGEDGRALLELGEIARLFLTGLPELQSVRRDVPRAFCRVIERCIKPIPTDRYADATELQTALEPIRDVFLFGDASLAEKVPAADVERVAESFSRVAARLDHFTARLYERLFAVHPRLRSLFPADLTQQRRKLGHALKLTVDGLRAPERLRGMLEELGRTHLSRGVAEADLALLGDALLVTLKESDVEHWEDPLDAAWRRAWKLVLESMVRGYASGEVTRRSVTPDLSTPSASPSARSSSSPASGGERSTLPPKTRYAECGEAHLAYQVFGSGPVDLLLLPGWLSQVETSWRHPSMASFLTSLSGFSRVITYDKRGSGLSDRTARAETIEQRAADAVAVLDGAGSTHAVLLGIAEGGATAVATAALYPGRVAGVIAYGASARFVRGDADGLGHPPEFVHEFETMIRERWGEAFFVELEAPSMTGDAAFADWLGEHMRLSASPREALAHLRSFAALDVRELAGRVSAPALVLQRAGDKLCPPGGGPDLAARLPQGRFVALDGNDHLPFVGDASAVLGEIEGFVRQILAQNSTVVSARGQGAA